MKTSRLISGFDSHGDHSADRSRNVLDPFDLVGMRKTPGSFMANFHETLGRPEWFLRGTPLAELSQVPEIITVRDYLTIMGNLKEAMPDPPYFLEYMTAGVPLYYGALDLGLRYAPDLLSALKLLPQYADDRPGFHHHRLFQEDGRTVLELVPATDLGAGRGFVVEEPLLYYMQNASRLAGQPVHDAIVEVVHDQPGYHEALRAAMGCDVRFGASRDAISFPDAACRKPSPIYDPELWRTATFRCRQEKKARSGRDALSPLRAIVARSMMEDGRIPRLAQAAEKMGVSGRTLIRRLRDEGLTYQTLVDELLQHLSKTLLADPKLSIARIAEELGFSDASGFHRRFRRWFGMTPSQFRREVLPVRYAAG